MYLNVDLEIRSRAKLEPLIAALGERVIVSHHSRRWLELLRSLRGEARRLLREARVIASIGYDEEDGTSTEVVVEPADVAALARLGVGIEVVVYRPSKMRVMKPRRGE